MFDPYMSERAKEFDRQAAMARARQFRLAQQARGEAPPRRWRLRAWLGAVFHSLAGLLSSPTGWLDSAAARLARPPGLVPGDDEAET